MAYEVDGQRYDEIPMTQTGFHHAVPVYEYFDGWWEDISKARELAVPQCASTATMRNPCLLTCGYSAFRGVQLAPHKHHVHATGASWVRA